MPARGVERWLTQRLSHRVGVGGRGGDGVCAGVRFLSPHSLVAMLLGKERDDPWDPDRLVWPLLAVIDESLDEPWCATLATHLGHGLDGDEGDLRRSRRYSVARRLAGLLASYAVQRHALVTDWREGRDTDGAGNPVEADLAWQPELWRRLVARVDAPPPDVRHAETLARLRAGGDGLDLPPRLSLFGHTRLPVTEVELLGALGELRDVHLWLPQVSAVLWDDLAEVAAQGPVPRAEDSSIRRVGHPLLGSLGRDARELQRTLGVVVRLVTVVSRRSLRSLLNHRRTRARPPATVLAGVVAGGPARQRRAGRGDAPGPRAGRAGPVAAGARLPRAGPPGRRAPRGAGRPARGRPDAGAARHPRDVPRHRDLRAADPGRVRARRPAGRAGGPPRAPAAAAARRPGAVEHQPPAGGGGHARRAGRRTGHRHRRARPGLGGTGATTVRLHRRRPRAAGDVGRGGGDPVGPRRRPPQRLRPPPRRQHLGERAEPDPARRHDGRARGRPLSPRRRRPAGGRRVVQRHRPGGTVRGVRRPAAAVRRRRRRGRLDRGVGGGPLLGRRAAHRRTHPGRLAAGAVRPRAVEDRRQRGRGFETLASSLLNHRNHAAAAGRRAAAAGAPAGRTADAVQLPHRHAHRLHDGADAVGAAPGGLPARPGRRGVPAGRLRRRRRRARAQPDDGGARRAQRGPAAVPRRDPRRRGDARGHLHRRQRAHRCRAATGRAAGGAAGRARHHRHPGRAGAGGGAAPAAAVRRAQPGRRRAGGRPPVQLRHRRARRGTRDARSPCRGHRARRRPAAATREP